MSNPPISGHNEPKREKTERKREDWEKKYQHKTGMLTLVRN